MLKKYLEQRHIELDSGRSCLALEREYWQALEVLTCKYCSQGIQLMKEAGRTILRAFAWIGFSSSILWVGLISISIFLYGASDLRNIPDLVLGFNNRRDIVMNILFYSFWLGVIYWPARLIIARGNSLLPWKI